MIEISGIKCDNINCDFKDDTVRFEDYDQYLNKPCPKCGSNLLTEADLRTTKILVLVFNNPITKFINWVLLKLGGKQYNGQIEMNGSGRINTTWEDK